MLSVGDIVGGTYRVERLLGQGGMARVFLVSHTRVEGKMFALKLISQPGLSENFMQRFKREADILGRLSHPHIVNIVDFNQTPDGLPYLVMEFLEGEDLSQFIERTGSLQKEVALSIVYQVGQALQSAHNAGVVHRDLKPANLFVCKNGAFPNYIKVLDFGIAKLLNDNGFTSDRSLMGTPSYMSPEQARGMVRQIDHRSDQFSLAVILYELLSGRKPFCPSPEADPLAIIAQIVSLNPPPLPFPGIWPALERALRKDIQERFPSIQEFVEATGARRAFGAMTKSPTMGTNTNGEIGPGGEFKTHRRAIWLGGVAAALAVSAVVFWQSRPPLTPPRPAATARNSPSSSLSEPATKTPGERALTAPGNEPAEYAKIRDAAGVSRDMEAEPRPESTSRDDMTAETAAKHKQAATRRPTTSPEIIKSAHADLSKSVPAGSSAGSATTTGFTVSVSGANAEQSSLIKRCAVKELRELNGMPKTYKISLQRSGTLHIIDSPTQIYNTELASCLRNQFKGLVVPESAVVTVRGSR